MDSKLRDDLLLIDAANVATDHGKEDWFKAYVKTTHEMIARMTTKEVRLAAFSTSAMSFEKDYRITGNKLTATRVAEGAYPMDSEYSIKFAADGNTFSVSNKRNAMEQWTGGSYGDRRLPSGFVVSYEAMPMVYRSAKSVVMRAIENELPLVDSEGVPFGKSALTRVATAEEEKKRDVHGYIRKKLKSALQEAKNNGIDDEGAKILFNEIRKEVYE